MAGLLEHVMINKLGDDLDEAITFVGGDTSMVSHISQYPEVIKTQLGTGAALELHEIIVPDESKIIISTDSGKDNYSTKYATGIKTDLIPDTKYLRLCTAVVGKEPVYIDLSSLYNGEGGDICDPQYIIDIILNTPEIKEYIINDLNLQINDLQSSLNTTQKEVGTIQEELNEIKEHINEIEGGSIDEDNINSLIDEKLEPITNSIKNINAQLKELDKDCVTEDEVIDIVIDSNQVKSLIDSKIESRVGAIETRLGYQESNLNALREDITKTNIKILEVDASSQANDLAIRSEISTLNTKFFDLESNVQANLLSQQNELTNLNTKINSFDASLEMQNLQIKSIEEDIKNVKSSFDEQTITISSLNNEIEKISRVTGQLSLNVINLESKINDISGGGGGELKEVIVEEDNYIIIADEEGRDYYNTNYAKGIKTGLEPGSMYIRICTAVKDKDPIYIPLDTLIKNLPTGEIGDINEIVNQVINSSIFNANLEKAIDNKVNDITEQVTTIESQIKIIQESLIGDNPLTQEETDEFFK